MSFYNVVTIYKQEVLNGFSLFLYIGGNNESRNRGMRNGMRNRNQNIFFHYIHNYTIFFNAPSLCFHTVAVVCEKYFYYVY